VGLSEARAIELWQEAWTAGELSGVAVFEEGLGILRSFVRRQGHLDHQDVLAIEKRFELSIGPFTVLGFIDRVDRVDDETVEVIDYKTNRMLFTREEVDASLQMSLYCDHRGDCQAYAEALRGERTVICEDLEDLEGVARERWDRYSELAPLRGVLILRSGPTLANRSSVDCEICGGRSDQSGAV